MSEEKKKQVAAQGQQSESDHSESAEMEKDKNEGPPKYLDLVFCMDCTGSMGSYIESARRSIGNIVEEIVAGEKSDVRFALVGYRDHPPQENSWVTKVSEFTVSVSKMRNQLSSISADGGGDCPEAVADGLHACKKLEWRKEATKIIVLISDAPPHGLDASSGDHWPNGCPAGLDPMVITRELAEMGVILYTVGCEPSILTWKEWFSGIAHLTGGRYCPLGNAQLLASVIVGGAQEELALEQALAQVEEEVSAEIDDGVDDDVLASKIQEKLKMRGVRAKKLQAGDEDLATATEDAKMYSKMTDMSSVRAKYASSGASSGPPMSKRGFFKSRMKKSARAGAPMEMPEGLDFAGGGGDAAPAAAAPSAYSSISSEVSYEQSARMVQRMKARKGKW